MSEEPSKPVTVDVPLLAGVLIYTSRAARRLGSHRVGDTLFRLAMRLAPGLRREVWLAATRTNSL